MCMQVLHSAKRIVVVACEIVLAEREAGGHTHPRHGGGIREDQMRGGDRVSLTSPRLLVRE